VDLDGVWQGGGPVQDMERQGGLKPGEDRQIFMDGRKHPPEPEPTWFGHSIGSWEGDTLVIDTVGFNDKFWFDGRGHPHTEQLHTIERWTRRSLGRMTNEVTIDDPGAESRHSDRRTRGSWARSGRVRLSPGYPSRRGSISSSTGSRS
jgi:hypothetical protein